MIITEIHAKTLLSSNKEPDPWFGIKYNMNLYRGCQHRCVYCDSRSLCYQIKDFDNEVIVKVNAPELLRKELASKRTKGTVCTGSMNDPYGPIERKYGLAGQALYILAEYQFPVHIITKSDLVVKDLPTLRDIANTYAAVSFTLTTTDDDLALKLEPNAPPPSARLTAMAKLSAAGIYTGVTMMPLLPFIEDNESNIREILQRASSCGAQYVIPSFGTTMRDGSREPFYAALDLHFPGLRQHYEHYYGDRYDCNSPQHRELKAAFGELCKAYGLAPRITPYSNTASVKQLGLF